jgi:hypothetical protein
MSDGNAIAQLLRIASDVSTLVNAQHIAARKLLDYDGEIYPSDGCAITLSTLLQEAGIDIADTFLAIALGRGLRHRGWSLVPVGQQTAGDVGSTCGSAPRHGHDHVYLVLKTVNADEMVIADNREPYPHFRFASGQGKTPTKFFLRAPS